MPTKGYDTSALAIFLTFAAATWLALIVLAPVGVARGRAPILTLAAYEMGARVCHQRPERSFHLAGVQMPVCARCFGLYLSGTVGLIAGWILRRQWSSPRTRLVLGVAALPIAATVALEWLGLIHTSNLARLLTGLPLGFVAGIVLVGSLLHFEAGARNAPHFRSHAL